MPGEPGLGELGAPTLQVYIDAAGSNAKSRKHDRDGKDHFSKWFAQRWDGNCNWVEDGLSQMWKKQQI